MRRVQRTSRAENGPGPTATIRRSPLRQIAVSYTHLDVYKRQAIDKAKDMKAKILFLESNTLLKPAIHTYNKLGFKELAENHPAYELSLIHI